jgi:biotin synthase
MNRLKLASPKLRRFLNRQSLIVAVAIFTLWFLIVQFRGDISQQWSQLGVQYPDARDPPRRMPTHNILPKLPERIMCYGPRGYLLGKSPDDDLMEREMDGRMCF